VSGAAVPSALVRDLRLLVVALVYELRKVTTWRAGFVVRELMRGMWRPVVMIFVYATILVQPTDRLGSYDFRGLVAYLVLAASFEKLLFHQRGLDLSDQIFQGYVTKYLTMPLRFFVLALARFAQHVLIQGGVVVLLWSAGALLLPQWWPQPASALALVEAALLVLLGSYCYFLTCFLVNALAFWLDVVWTLSAMTSFVFSFCAGVLVPVSVMPAALRDTLQWLFPYWAVNAPAEVFLGRLGHADFLRGIVVLGLTAVVLELVRQVLWRRGLARYVGAGM
jgi:ABC-2 type transport system permease protein